MRAGEHALTLAPPLMLWAATVYKLPALSRGRPEPALSAYWSAIAWLAVAMTLYVPDVAQTLDRLSHVPNVAWLAMYAAVLLSGFSATVALLHELVPDTALARRTRARKALCAALIAALAVLFAAGHPRQETPDFVTAYGGQPVLAAFLTCFYTGLALVCLDMIPACWRAAASVSGLLRLALRGSGLAAAASLLYVIYNEVVVVQLLTGHPGAVVGDPLEVSRVSLVAIVGLIAVGTSSPDWGPRLHLDAAATWLAQYRARRRLFDLWYDMGTCVPEVHVPAPQEPRRPRTRRLRQLLGPRRVVALHDALSMRDAHWLLHRRVISVTDGRLALAGFHDAVATQALLGQLPDVEADPATQEAAALTASVAAKRDGRGPTRAAPVDAAPAALEGWSLADEVTHLTAVARSYRRLRRRRVATYAPAQSPAASSQT